MSYDEIMNYKEDALTRGDAEAAADIYMLSRACSTAKVTIIRVDESFDRHDAIAKGAVFYPLHQIIELLETSLESGREIGIDLN